MNDAAEVPSVKISPDTTMSALQEALPGARRALFARYHIGGCASCGFQPEETLAQVCARNNENVDEVIAHLLASQEQDAKMQISPPDLAALLKDGQPLRLLDVRSREEYEAVKLPGAELMSQPLLQELFKHPDKEQRIVVYCHHGQRSLDAAAYLVGHGFQNVKSLAGGIDAWSLQVDPTLPRYRLEME